MTTAPVKILDLPISHLAFVERKVGARMTDWPEGVGSVAELYGYALAAGRAAQQDRPAGAIQAIYDKETSTLTMNELAELVQLSGDDEVDPT